MVLVLVNQPWTPEILHSFLHSPCSRTAVLATTSDTWGPKSDSFTLEPVLELVAVPSLELFWTSLQCLGPVLCDSFGPPLVTILWMLLDYSKLHYVLHMARLIFASVFTICILPLLVYILAKFSGY